MTSNFRQLDARPLYSASGNVALTQPARRAWRSSALAISTGNPAASRMRVTASDGLQAAAGGWATRPQA